MNIQDGIDKLQKQQEQLKQLKENVPIPIPIDQVDWSRVYNVCVEYIQTVAQGKSTKYFAMEEDAMESVFGPDVYTWINAITDLPRSDDED